MYMRAKQPANPPTFVTQLQIIIIRKDLIAAFTVSILNSAFISGSGNFRFYQVAKKKKSVISVENVVDGMGQRVYTYQNCVENRAKSVFAMCISAGRHIFIFK